MKISKLFHWLYASLMLLPLLVFIPNAFYYGFNEHAVAQEKTEQVPVYYESNEVNNSTDLHTGNVYLWTDNFTQDTSIPNNIYFYLSYTDSLSQFDISNNDTNIRFLMDNGRLYVKSDQSPYRQVISTEFYFLLKNFASGFQYIPDSVIDKISIYNGFVFKEYQPLTTNMSITDSMSYAWDSVWQNDLFSWSYGSFLTEPFIYIGNLFNVPVDNSLFYALSYWLDISIIWLTFDLVMYIPLLVHRWLDKGIIE